MPENVIFKPAKSNGGKYIIIITIALTLLFSILFISIYPSIQIMSLFILLLCFFLAIIAVFTLLIYAYYELEYILSNEFLLIKWGLKTKRIPVAMVKRIIRSESKDYEGIRLGGVGLPGYLFGRFKFLIDGKFETVSLYATKLNNLLFIETNGKKKKLYGITPANEGDFINMLQSIDKNIGSQVVNKTGALKDTMSSSKDIKLALSLFIFTIILSISGLVYFLIIYFQLPQTIPLHFNINFVPDRYGDKTDLLGIISIFIIFGIGFSALLYYYIHRRTHLDQTKYGYSIMLLPIAINVLFLILTIVILNETLAFS